jgi:hypothetical protein
VEDNSADSCTSEGLDMFSLCSVIWVSISWDFCLFSRRGVSTIKYMTKAEIDRGEIRVNALELGRDSIKKASVSGANQIDASGWKVHPPGRTKF